ncbi:MAG: hypothetical protein RL220_1228 [Bacteroidota bacterium]
MRLMKYGWPTHSAMLRNFDDMHTRNAYCSPRQSRWGNMPAVNVKETEKTFEIEFAVPGYDKGDFRLNVKDNTLTVSCEKNVSAHETGEKYSRREWSYSSFSRSFRLPEVVNANAIEADYTNGVLRVTLPKTVEAKEENAIEVKVK